MTESLSFDGERFLPECSGEIWYEHWHRYALARQLSRRARVLDVASGEGYGAAMLAESAARVVGVDISPDAVRHARSRYGERANLGFVTASCDNLPFADASFDLAVSFETIEHIETQQEFIAELARVLRPDGVLILSSPNKHAYSDAHDYHNEFHVRELYRNELEDLLQATFPHILWFGQKLLFHSAIWPENQVVASVEFLIDEGSRITVASNPSIEPMYYLAVCSRNSATLPAMLGKLSLFGDTSESVYRDYIKLTKQVIDLDRLLINRERLITERDDLLTLRTQQMEERERLIVERDAILTLRTDQLNESAFQIKHHEQQIEAREQHIAMLNLQLAKRASLAWWLKLPLLLLKRAFKADS